MKKNTFAVTEMEQYTSSSNEIETSLYFLKQRLPDHYAEKNAHNLKRIAETKRLAALLYLRERLDLIDDTTNNNIRSSTTDISVVVPSATARLVCKRHLVSSIIDLMSTLPDSPTLLWPLFILGNTGLEESEHHRRFVLDRLERIQRTRNLGSVHQTRLAVQRAFCLRDLDYPCGRVWGDAKSGFISLAWYFYIDIYEVMTQLKYAIWISWRKPELMNWYI